jgi:2-polyprenyl-6-methoxyphenol hydroxylase-like FAD-dependent oxidoreductase
MSLIRGPSDFGIPKIPLSHILKPEDALQAITDTLCNVHHEINQGGQATHRTAIAGNDSEVLWNTLLNFYEGGHVAFINDKPIIPRTKFLPSEALLQELLGSIIEVDIPEHEWNANIPPEHPFWVLQNMLQVYENKRTDVKDPAFKNKSILAFTNLLDSMIKEIAIKGPDLQLINAELVGISDAGAVVSDGTQEITIPAEVVVRQDKGKLIFEPLAFPSIIDHSSQARSMHNAMISATRYLDKYEQSLTDFATKPNKDADNLFDRVQARRPKIPDEKRPKVSVVGLGPSGTIAAIRAYQEGAKVKGIEARTGYSRNNTFRFIPELMDDFFKLFVDNPEVDIPALEDNHPIKMAFGLQALGKKGASPAWGQGWHEFTPVTFRDFEYLVNSWINLMAARDPEGMQIFRGYRYKPGSVNGNANEIEIEATGHSSSVSGAVVQAPSRISIPTDILIGSDGYNSRCREDAGIRALKMSTAAQYGTYNFHPPRSDENDFFKSLLKPIPRRVVDIEELKALGWQHDREPVPRFFNTGNHPYLGIEIPPNIVQDYRAITKDINELLKAGPVDEREVQKLREHRTNLMEAWGKATIRMFVSDEDLDKLILKDCAVIDVQLQKSETVTATTPSQVKVLLIGDAAQSAHFQTGSGAIMGIRGGFDVGIFVKGIMAGRSYKEMMEAFEKSGRERGVALHEWAFNFPSGEELNVRPTVEFEKYRSDTRRALLLSDPSGQQAQHTSISSRVVPENSGEAQQKANAIVTRKKR